MKKVNFKVKIIALLMSLVMIFVTLPAQAIVLDNENADTSELPEQVVSNGGDSVKQDVFIVEEDVSKRGQFEKHYLCSDGTYVSVTYPEAVHYLDANNSWQDVDQSLTYDSATKTYKSGNSDFEVSFSESASSTNIARIERNGYTLSWGIQTSKNANIETAVASYAQIEQINGGTANLTVSPSADVKAQPINSTKIEYSTPSDRLVTDDDSYYLPNVSSQIHYNNAFTNEQNVSLKYTVYHNKIEEDIIISERSDIQSVSMNMNIGTLSPVVNENGSVDLVDGDGVMQFRIGIPYMMDAEFEICYDVSVTAKKDGDICTIIYTPDSEWFGSSERVFPILLDPSITTGDYVANIEDTYVQENSTTDHSASQYMYFTHKNNGDRRKAVIRIKKLPVIDQSMPIIGAELVLNLQSGPSKDIGMKAGYFVGYSDFESYDYQMATNGYKFVTYCTVASNVTQVTFDFTPHIYSMYSDEEYEIRYNDSYEGDFIIGLEDDDDDTFIRPFYSSECTTPELRPALKVRYGYTLPAGMLDGGVYSFQNGGSRSYMTVNGAEPANNSNVYQVENSSEIATTEQKFKLEYVASTGAYLFRSMSSSSGTDKVLSIQRSGGEIYSGRNVQIYSATDPISQEWFVVPVNRYVFRVVPRSNMALALTANESSNGTNTGTTADSPGNIFVQTLDTSNYYQMWYIFDDNDEEVYMSEYRSAIETGCYYLTNRSIGKYLHWSNSYANCQRGLLSTIGDDTVKWKIVNLGDGYCTIQRADVPGYYLSASTESSSGVRVYNDSSETIPDIYKWAISTAVSGGGVLIQNKSNGKYLYASDQATNPSSISTKALYAVDTDGYSKQAWRIVLEDIYCEPSSTLGFYDLAIDIDDTVTASINAPLNGFWIAYSDFEYTITSGSQYVTYDASTHRFTGVAPGTAAVLATHKTTGLTRTFNIKVNKQAIIIVPGIFASELFVGENNPYFKEHAPIINQDMVNTLSMISQSLDSDDISNLIAAYVLSLPVTGIPTVTFANMFYDTLSCNDNGLSKYDVYTKKYVYVQPTYADNDTDHSNPIYTLPSSYDSRYYTPHAGLLNSYYELINELYSDPDITSKYAIEFFSYDWRLSNTVSAEKLDAFIDECGYDKVILISHSMGGLVSSGYMAIGEEQRNKVEEVYMLSSPLLGTPEVINVWANVDISALAGGDYENALNIVNAVLTVSTLTSDPLQKLFSNYPSIYELFPSEYYLSANSMPYLTHYVSTILPFVGETTETPCDDYATSMRLISGYLPHFNSTLMTEAEAFHDSCMLNNKHITYSANSKYICVSGVATTVQLRYFEIISQDLYSRGIEINYEDTIGDGLVPSWSATLGRSGDNIKVYTGKYNHMYTIRNGALNDWISYLEG